MIRGLLFFTLFFSFSFYAQAEQDMEICIPSSDFNAIASHYKQFKDFQQERQESYCSNDMDEKWFQVARALQVLKTISPDHKTHNESDALAYNAISEKDWWTYLKRRSKHFRIHESCQEYVVAYVQPFFYQDIINLCPLFFEESPADQASTLMHEVRHFDGHRHVTCKQGNEEGMEGACDDTITSKGSYAVSVQTLVGLAGAESIHYEEKEYLQAMAVYIAYNKFNKVPKIRMKEDIILSNAQGEVYKWSPSHGTKKLLARLNEPAEVLTTGPYLTFFPLDKTQEAFRTNKDLTLELKNPGLFARLYNSEAPEERAQYKSVSYLGTAGALKENTLTTLCDNTNLSEVDLSPYGDFQSIISLTEKFNDANLITSLLVSKHGEIYEYRCKSPQSLDVLVTKTSYTLSQDTAALKESFTLAGSQFALLSDGSLVELNLEESGLLGLKPLSDLEGSLWVSASPFSQPEVFD